MSRPFRLPREVHPTIYEIDIHADVDDETFSGRVQIALALAEPVDVIVLHGRDITVREARFIQGESRNEVVICRPDAETETLAFPLASPAEPGEAVLDIEYDGRVSRNMEGLYLSQDGDERCLATQCEETDARGIFPCFDEPAFKARFHLSVTTRIGVTVLGNGPLASVERQEEKATWRFDPTNPMSSYLFALAIGPFAPTEELNVRGVPLRVWALAGKERLGAFGNKLAAELLPWFEDHFGAPYHFDKYDQVAVPSFSAGAMENSGLIIFRQSLLLHDPATTSWQQEKLIARVISHEFAHQWFGNLVTMDWWDDIWLNESFAEWIAHKALDAVAPDYGIWAALYANKRDALVTDALATTHPIYTPVETPEQATELFDTVTYSKGSVLMRMIERQLGEDAFREGLRAYMREFSEKNARGEDLWRHLGTASGAPVDRLALSWILQPGFPLVDVHAAPGQLVLRQRRFYSSPDEPLSDQLWAIPLVVRYRDDEGVHERRILFEAREETVALPVKGALHWLHANADGVGFYRQALDHELRAKLIAHAGELEASEQRDILDDAWALARARVRPIEDFLEVVIPVARHAKDHHVLGSVVGALETVSDILHEHGDDATRARYRAWATEALAPEAKRLGYAHIVGETRDDTERRAIVLRGMGRFAREPAALAAARDIAGREVDDPASVDPSLAGPAVDITAHAGDAATHARFLATYDARRAAGVPPQLVQRYLYNLGSFEDPALVDATLALLAAGRFPLEARGPMLRAMLDAPHAREPAWRHIQQEWKTIRETLGDMWTGFLVEHLGNLPPRLRGDVVAFLDANLHGVAQQAYGRALEAMDLRAKFEPEAARAISDWLKDRH